MQAVRKYQILYIEDDDDMFDLVELILRRVDGNGYEVQGVTSGNVGIELMRQNPPDLVLLDIMLPDMIGWAVYQRMQADPLLRDIPVIIVTAQNAPIDRMLGEQVAQLPYITKPFSPKDLRAAVRQILG